MQELSQIPYKIQSYTSQSPTHPITNLQSQSKQSQGWQSSEYCPYPQTLILSFAHVSQLTTLQFFAHHTKIPKRIAIYYKKANADGSDGDGEGEDWRKVGHTTFDSNQKNLYKARELKRVNLPAIRGKWLKLEIQGCYENQHNVMNQVGLIYIIAYGKILQPPPKPQPQPKSPDNPINPNPQNEETPLKCIICFTKSRNCLFTPCNHLVCCFEDCGPKMKECPICRAQVKPVKIQEAQPQETDLQIYDYIINTRQAQILYWQSRGQVACLTQIIFKVIVIILLYFKTILINMIEDTLIKELMVFFSVVDFWFTKNYNGKRLLGLHWSFSDDPYGEERFKYQFRINQEYMNRTGIRIFWLSQIIYIAFPILYFYVQGLNFYIESNLLFQFIIIGWVIVLGFINFILFYKASTFASRKRLDFVRHLPENYVKKFSYNSIVSYY